MSYTLEKIENIADIIHNNTAMQDSTVIDVVEVANKLGFTVYWSDFHDDVSGMVKSSPEEKSIYVNKSDIPQRQRFTIAHEIGHIVLHHDFGTSEFTQVDYRNANNSYDHKEWEANAFASALLMPKDKAIEIWKSIQDVDDFANIFKVSKLAASIRLQNLGLI